MSCRCPVQEALVVKLLNSTFLCIYLGKFGLCLLCFYFINFLPCRSSVTYARCMVVLLYWSGVWFFWLLLRILASPVAEPCSAYGGCREECIPYFFTCTLIFMYMQPDILILTVVRFFFRRCILNKTDIKMERIEAVWVPAIYIHTSLVL